MDELLIYTRDHIGLYGDDGLLVSELDRCYQSYYDNRGQESCRLERANNHGNAAADVAVDDNFKEFVWEYLIEFPGLYFMRRDDVSDEEEIVHRAGSCDNGDNDDTPAEYKKGLTAVSWKSVHDLYPDLKVRVASKYVNLSLFGTQLEVKRVTENKVLYKCLKLVATSREHGITQLRLSRELELDPRSVFHFVRVLERLGLVAKFAYSDSGSNTSLIVHARFARSLSAEVAKKCRYAPSLVEDPSNGSADNQPNEAPAAVAAVTELPLRKKFRLVRQKMKNRIIRALYRAQSNIMVEPDLFEAVGLNLEKEADLRFFKKLVTTMEDLNLVWKVRARIKIEGGKLSTVRTCIRLNVANVEERYGKVGDELQLGDDASDSERGDDSDRDEDEDEDDGDRVPQLGIKEDIKYILSMPNMQRGQIVTMPLHTQVFWLLAQAGHHGIIGKAIQYMMDERRYKVIFRAVQSLLKYKDDSGPYATTMMEMMGRERRMRYFLRDDLIHYLEPLRAEDADEGDETTAVLANEQLRLEEGLADRDDAVTAKSSTEDTATAQNPVASPLAQTIATTTTGDTDSGESEGIQPRLDQALFQKLYDGNNGKLSVNSTLIQYVILQFLESRKIVDSTMEFQNELIAQVMELYALLKRNPKLIPIVYRRKSEDEGEGSMCATQSAQKQQQQQGDNDESMPCSPQTPVSNRHMRSQHTISLFSSAMLSRVTAFRIDKRTITRAMDSLADIGLAHVRKIYTQASYDSLMEKGQREISEQPRDKDGNIIDNPSVSRYKHYYSQRVVLVHPSIDPNSDVVDSYLAGLQDRETVTKVFIPTYPMMDGMDVQRTEGADERDKRAAVLQHKMYLRIRDHKRSLEAQRQERQRKRLKLQEDSNDRGDKENEAGQRKLGTQDQRGLIAQALNVPSRNINDLDFGFINARMVRSKLFHEFLCYLVSNPSIDPTRIFSHRRIKTTVLFQQLPLRLFVQLIPWSTCPLVFCKFIEDTWRAEVNKADRKGGPRPLDTPLVDLPSDIRLIVMKKVRDMRNEFRVMLYILEALGLLRPLDGEYEIMTEDNPPPLDVLDTSYASKDIQADATFQRRDLAKMNKRNAENIVLQRRQQARYFDRLSPGYQIMNKVYMRDYSHQTMELPLVDNPLRVLTTETEVRAFWEELQYYCQLGAVRALNLPPLPEAKVGPSGGECDEGTPLGDAAICTEGLSPARDTPKKAEEFDPRSTPRDSTHPLYYLSFSTSWHISQRPTLAQRNVLESCVDQKNQLTPLRNIAYINCLALETSLSADYIKSYFRRWETIWQRRQEMRRKQQERRQEKKKASQARKRQRIRDDSDDAPLAELLSAGTHPEGEPLSEKEHDIEAALRRRRQLGRRKGERAGRKRRPRDVHRVFQDMASGASVAMQETAEATADEEESLSSSELYRHVQQPSSAYVASRKFKWSTRESNRLLHAYVICKYKFNQDVQQLSWVPMIPVFPQRTFGKRSTEKLRRHWEKLMRSPSNVQYLSKLYTLWQVLYPEAVTNGKLKSNHGLPRSLWNMIPELEYLLEVTQNTALDELLEQYHINVTDFTHGLLSRLPPSAILQIDKLDDIGDGRMMLAGAMDMSRHQTSSTLVDTGTLETILLPSNVEDIYRYLEVFAIDEGSTTFPTPAQYKPRLYEDCVDSHTLTRRRYFESMRHMLTERSGWTRSLDMMPMAIMALPIFGDAVQNRALCHRYFEQNAVDMNEPWATAIDTVRALPDEHRRNDGLVRDNIARVYWRDPECHHFLSDRMQRLLPAVEATSQGDDRESPPSANEALVTVGDSERAGWMSYRRIVGYYLKLTGRSEKQEEDQNQYITQGLIQCLILATLLTSESKYSSAYSYDLLNKNPRWDPAAVSMAIDLLRTHNSIVYTKGHPNTTVSVHIPKQLSDNASITDGSEALIGEGKTVPSQSQSANGDSDSQRGAPLAKRKRMQPRMPGRGFCVSDKFLLAIKGVFPNRLFIAQSHLAQRKWEAAILSDESGRGSDENAGNNGEGVLGERGSRAPGLFDFNPLLGSGEMAFLFSQLTTGAVYTLAKYPVVTNAHKAVRNSFKMGDVRMYDFNITFCVPWQAVEWLRKARDGLARENKSLEPPPLYNVLPAGTRLSSDAPGDNTQCQQQAADSVLEGAVVEEVRDAGMMGLDLISLKAQLLARLARGSLDTTVTDAALMRTVRSLLHYSLQPRIYQVGFTELRYVAPEHYHRWVISTQQQRQQIKDAPATREEIVTPLQRHGNSVVAPPRIWFDIYGHFNLPVWRGCIQAIASWIATYPGIYESRLAFKMVCGLNRAELREILDDMVSRGIVMRKTIVDRGVRGRTLSSCTSRVSGGRKPVGLFGEQGRSKTHGFSLCSNDIIREDKITCYWVTTDYLSKI